MRYLIPLAFLVASLPSCSSPDRCSSVSDCPAAHPCEHWACGAATAATPGAMLGCVSIPSPVGTPCDNGDPGCSGFCNGDVTCDAPMCMSDAETAYPCGFPGSPKIDECGAVVPGGIPYCGHDGPVPAPFADCKAMPADAGDEWAWWCCSAS